MAAAGPTPFTGVPPVADSGWVRPSSRRPAEPRWGHPAGIQIGLHPLGGPRGLLRVYTPYLGHDRMRLVNFVAVEPIVVGGVDRGFSELEVSELDETAGKRFWSMDEPGGGAPGLALEPARGVIEEVDGVECLTVWIGVERFANGAEVDVRLRFRADRPHEVSLAARRRARSVPLATCVLTATMGNYARLRRLHLRDRVITAAQLWPDFTGNHFADHAAFPLSDLARDGRAAIVAATPDETAPGEARYDSDVRDHWHYSGRRAVQGWLVPDPDPELRVLVNGRRVYWASEAVIPGGVSFENFEIVEPYRDDAEYIFWVEPFETDDGIDGLLVR
jgi:hypothetical protein